MARKLAHKKDPDNLSTEISGEEANKAALKRREYIKLSAGAATAAVGAAASVTQATLATDGDTEPYSTDFGEYVQ